MSNYYKREEIGPCGYSVVRRPAEVQKSKSAHQFKDSNSSLPPLPRTNRIYKATDSPYVYRTRERRPLNDDYAKPPPLPTTPRTRKLSFRENNSIADNEKIQDIRNSLSRRTSISEELKSPSLSRRPSLKNIEVPKPIEVPKRNYYSSYEGKPYEPTNRAPRPFSTSYLLTSPSLSSIPMTSSRSITSTNASPAPSTRASPVRDFGIPASGYSSRRNSISSKDIENVLQFPTASGSQLPSGTGTGSGIGSRRNSIVRERLPWPEPSPARELPPPMPKQKVKHYPLPPPSYTEGMIAVSRRIRNRSASPAPNYSEMELSTRPTLVPAALGRPSPSREMIRMSLCGPSSGPLKQYHLGKAIY